MDNWCIRPKADCSVIGVMQPNKVRKMQAYNLILARLWPVSVIQRQPYRFASLFGVCVGLVSSASGIVAATLLIGMFKGEDLGSSAGAFLSSFAPWSLFLMGVVFIPFWETFTGQLLPLEIGRAIGFNDAACAALGQLFSEQATILTVDLPMAYVQHLLEDFYLQVT